LFVNVNIQINPFGLRLRRFHRFQHGGQRQLLDVVRVGPAAHNDSPGNALDTQIPHPAAGSPRDRTLQTTVVVNGGLESKSGVTPRKVAF
jgi:hypothetical protein